MSVIPRFMLSLDAEELEKITSQLDDTSLHKKEKIEQFEEKFASYVDRKYAVFLPSARFGYYRILQFLNLKPGDGVIVPAWTHPSIPSMIASAGLKPMFCDIEEGTYNMSVDTIPTDYWDQAKAITITHLYGCPAPAAEIIDEAEKHGLKIIEDCAQALGARVGDRKTGSFGEASIFSLSMTKNMTTLKGGAVATDNPDLAESLRESRTDKFTDTSALKKVIKTCKIGNLVTGPAIYTFAVYPGLLASILAGVDPIHEKFKEKFEIKKPPKKMPTPHPVQAMLGMRQLGGLDAHNAGRNKNGKLLLDRLGQVEGVVTPTIPENAYHIFMSFVLMVDNPWEFKKKLLLKGIDTSPGYLRSIPRMPQFKDFYVQCPIAEKLEKMQIHVPVYPQLKQKQVEKIADAILSCAGEI